MKKMITICATALFAAFAQASTVSWSSGKAVNWGTGGSGWKSGNGVITASSANYTMVISLYADEAMQSAIEITSGGSKTGTSSKSKIANNAVTSSDIKAGTTYYIQGVITDSSNGSTLTTQLLSFVFDGGTADPTIDFMSSSGAGLSSLASVNGSYSSTYGWYDAGGWVAAPEPTSGLLLLIGVAGLALRRRRA